MNIKELSEDILRLVGGEDNVVNVVHCATRLRFSLRDMQKADVKALEKLDGVITTMQASGQFQVVIGNRVAEVYRQICSLSSRLNDDSPQKSGHKTQATNIVSRLIDIISSIFTPLLGAMAAAGVLKGILSIILSEGWMSKTETTYIILAAAADSLFYFLPVLLAVTTARKFQGNIYVAASIAGALIYPTIVELYRSFCIRQITALKGGNCRGPIRYDSSLCSPESVIKKYSGGCPMSDEVIRLTSWAGFPKTQKMISHTYDFGCDGVNKFKSYV